MQGVIYALNIFIAISVILGILFGMRWKYQHDIAPSKKYPRGRMIAEFWTESGDRYRELCEVMANGWEIKAPRGHKNPRYFFYRKAMGRSKYPLQPLLPFSFVQIDVPIVSWYENDPNPIDPKRKTPFVTSEMLDLVRDTDTLAAGQAIDEELAATQRQLANALVNKLDKRWVYGGLVYIGLVVTIGAVLTYMTYGDAHALATMWGAVQ